MFVKSKRKSLQINKNFSCKNIEGRKLEKNLKAFTIFETYFRNLNKYKILAVLSYRMTSVSSDLLV